MSFTYWAFDDTCLDPKTDGYVGVTEAPGSRRFGLITAGTIPKDAMVLILFEGERWMCLRLEREYRPTKGIGWNNDRGGTASRPDKFGCSNYRRGRSPDVLYGVHAETVCNQSVISLKIFAFASTVAC